MWEGLEAWVLQPNLNTGLGRGGEGSREIIANPHTAYCVPGTVMLFMCIGLIESTNYAMRLILHCPHFTEEKTEA